MKKILILILGIALVYSCTTSSDENDNSTETFENVQIGNQTWMKKNLNVTKYRNGDLIPQVTDPTQWKNLTTGAWCYYNNDSANGDVYGKLYNWYAVNDTRGLAPVGYHIPSNTDWTNLIDFLGGQYTTAGSLLKEEGTTHWTSPNTGATNSSGFTGLPGGSRFYYNGTFQSIQEWCYFWSSSSTNSRQLTYSTTIFQGATSSFPKANGFSVRCLKD